MRFYWKGLHVRDVCLKLDKKGCVCGVCVSFGGGLLVDDSLRLHRCHPPCWSGLLRPAKCETTAAWSGSCCSRRSPRFSGDWTSWAGAPRPAHPWTPRTASAQNPLETKWQCKMKSFPCFQNRKKGKLTYCIPIKSGGTSEDPAHTNIKLTCWAAIKCHKCPKCAVWCRFDLSTATTTLWELVSPTDSWMWAMCLLSWLPTTLAPNTKRWSEYSYPVLYY